MNRAGLQIQCRNRLKTLLELDTSIPDLPLILSSNLGFALKLGKIITTRLDEGYTDVERDSLFNSADLFIKGCDVLVNKCEKFQKDGFYYKKTR